jgi:dihydrofolate reductase
MRRVRFSVAMSLDGYIAGPNGEYDWIVMDPDIDFRSMMNEFDTILLGRKTYLATKSQGGAGMPGMTTYVFSRTLPQADCKGVTVSTDPKSTVAEIRKGRGKDIWLFGGGELFASLLSLGLVDSVEVAVVPVLLGAGIPVLPTSVGHAKLRLANHRVYPQTGTVSLEYVPAK